MKIAQIVCVFPPYKGGLGNAALNLATLCAVNGNDSVVFTPRYKNFFNDSETNTWKFETKRLKPWLAWGNAAILPQLLWKLKDFDVVFLHYPFFGSAEIIWLAKVILRQRFKLVVCYHMDTESLSGVKKIFSWPSRLILPQLLAVADAIVCASFDYLTNSRLNKYYVKYPVKFYEIPFGVDIVKFKPKVHLQSNNIKQLIFVGGLDRAHNFKGIDILLNAISKIKISNFHLTIVGGGEAENYYTQLASKLQLDEKVTFYGRVTDKKLINLYSQSDILILPSINSHEAFGIVLLEAMASGLAVIASALPGVRSVFTDKKEGLLAQPGSESDLRAKIEFLLNNAEVLATMKMAARRLVEAKYSNSIVGSKISDLLKLLNS